MSRELLLSCCLVTVLSAGTALAHHTGRSHTSATVQIPAGVMADGKPIAAGTYEVYVYDERPVVAANIAPSDNQATVEFVQNGTVVAKEIAEVFAHGERAVGTSGGGTGRATVQRLRGNEFVRVAITGAGARYLIHLPAGAGQR